MYIAGNIVMNTVYIYKRFYLAL